MNISQACIDLIKQAEGCRLEAYPDPATGGDPWTVGYGDTGPDVEPGLTITLQDAEDRLRRRLNDEFAPGVFAALTREPAQEEFDAMVSLAYNIGLGAFRGSSVCTRFNRGERQSAADAFLMWDKAGGKVMRGLTRRRAAERALYLS